MTDQVDARRERLALTPWARIYDRLTPAAIDLLIERSWAIHYADVELIVADLEEHVQGEITDAAARASLLRTADARTRRVVDRVFGGKK